MITKIIEWLAVFTIIILLITWIPSTSDYPMPSWLTDNIEQSFTWMKLLLQFPVLNTCFYLCYLFFIWIWLPLQIYNTAIKFLSLFPSLEHLKKLQIK